MHLKMSSAKWRPFCLGLNVLERWALSQDPIILIMGIPISAQLGLTPLPLHKMAAISQTIYSYALS